MKAKKTKGHPKKPFFSSDALGFIFVAIGLLSFCALLSFHFMQPSSNWLGTLGYIAALAGEYLFGLGAYLIPLYLIWNGIQLLKGKKKSTYRL
jgi:hypothetical protein